MEQSKIIDTLETYHPTSPLPFYSPSLSRLPLFRLLLVVLAATMSETGEVIVDKDNSNNMGNFDAFDDPPEEPTILHTKKF